MDVSDVADQCGRCRWHLLRSVRYLLYNDDVSGDRNQQLTSEVRELAYTDYVKPVAAQATLTRWAAVRRHEAPQVAGHIERAAPQGGVYSDRIRRHLLALRSRQPLLSSGRCASSIVGSRTGDSGPAPAPRTCFSGTGSTATTRSGGPSGSPIRLPSDHRAVSQS